MKTIHAAFAIVAVGMSLLPGAAAYGQIDAPTGLPSGTVSGAIDNLARGEQRGFIVRMGQTYVIQGGLARPLEQDLILRVSPNGTITGFDGRETTIPEGKMLTTDGQLVTAPKLTFTDGTPSTETGAASGAAALSGEAREGSRSPGGGATVFGAGNDLDRETVDAIAIRRDERTLTRTPADQQSETTDTGQAPTDVDNPFNRDPNDPNFGQRTIPGDPTGRGTSQSVNEGTATDAASPAALQQGGTGTGGASSGGP